jgi:hypothetical protein
MRVVQERLCLHRTIWQSQLARRALYSICVLFKRVCACCLPAGLRHPEAARQIGHAGEQAYVSAIVLVCVFDTILMPCLLLGQHICWHQASRRARNSASRLRQAASSCCESITCLTHCHNMLTATPRMPQPPSQPLAAQRISGPHLHSIPTNFTTNRYPCHVTMSVTLFS